MSRMQYLLDKIKVPYTNPKKDDINDIVAYLKKTKDAETQSRTFCDESFYAVKHKVDQSTDPSLKRHFYLQALARLAYYKDGKMVEWRSEFGKSNGGGGGSDFGKLSSDWDDYDTDVIFYLNKRGKNSAVKRTLLELHETLSSLQEAYYQLEANETNALLRKPMLATLDKQWTAAIQKTIDEGAVIKDPFNILANLLSLPFLILFNVSNVAGRMPFRLFKYTERSKLSENLNRIAPISILSSEDELNSMTIEQLQQTKEQCIANMKIDKYRKLAPNLRLLISTIDAKIEMNQSADKSNTKTPKL